MLLLAFQYSGIQKEVYTENKNQNEKQRNMKNISKRKYQKLYQLKRYIVEKYIIHCVIQHHTDKLAQAALAKLIENLRKSKISTG